MSDGNLLTDPAGADTVPAMSTIQNRKAFIGYWLTQRGKTQRDVARMASTTAGQVARVIGGSREGPSAPAVWKALAKCTGFSVAVVKDPPKLEVPR